MKIPWQILISFVILLLWIFVRTKNKEHFGSAKDCCGIPGEVNMCIPPGQIVSEVPISRDCLLESYRLSCKKSKPVDDRTNNNVYDYKPFHDIEWSYNKPGGPENSNLVVPGRYPIRKTRCDDLPVHKCLTTPGCGWLVNKGGDLGRCLPGTPIGPLNPLHIPDAEDAKRKNITLDNWKYAHPNPFIKQFFPS